LGTSWHGTTWLGYELTGNRSPGPKASLVPGSPGTGAAAPGKLPGKINTKTLPVCSANRLCE